MIEENNKPILVTDSAGEVWEISSEKPETPSIRFKLIIIGESGVGKSCLTIRATHNKFEDITNSTIGFEYTTVSFIKRPDVIIELQIWDTCGLERYRSLITNFYHNATLAILVYSINNKESFNDLEIWLKELKMYSNPDAKVFVIGNKVDLEHERQVTYEKGKEFTQKYKLNLFMETSAKTGFNAHNIFVEAAKLLYDEHLKYNDNDQISNFKSGLPSVVTRITVKSYNNGCSC